MSLNEENAIGAREIWKEQRATYTKMTEIQDVNWRYKTFKAALQDSSAGKPMVDCLDLMNECTNCNDCMQEAADSCVKCCIWCGPAPGMFYSLENFHDNGVERQQSNETFIVRENRTRSEQCLGKKKGFFSISKAGDEAPLLTSEYAYSCIGSKTYFLMKDANGNVVASHQLNEPTTCADFIGGCFSKCTGCLCCCCSCCCGKSSCPKTSYTLLSKFQTPLDGQASKTIPMWKSATSIEPQNEEVRFMGPTCFAMCYGKKLESVEYPTYFSLATEPVDPAADADAERPSAQDNRVVRKDVSICTRMWNILSPEFDISENLGALGLDALNVLLEAKDNLDAAKEANHAIVEQPRNWKKIKSNTQAFDFPQHFTANQKAAVLLNAIEYSIGLN